MALSASTKANIENLKRIIEGLQRDIENYNRTIKANNSKTGSKSAGDHAKIQKNMRKRKSRVIAPRLPHIESKADG